MHIARRDRTAHIVPITREGHANDGYVCHIPNVNDGLIHACVASPWIMRVDRFFFSPLDVRQGTRATLFEKNQEPQFRSGSVPYVRLPRFVNEELSNQRDELESRFQTHNLH